MTQSERFDYILKLESNNNKQKLKRDLAEAKRKVKQEAINAQISIITTQVAISICAGFGGVEL